MGNKHTRGIFGGDSIDPKDIFDLLGGKFGEGIFGRKPPVAEKDPKGAALLKTFRKEIVGNDRQYLERIVVEYKEEVHSRVDNVNLLEAHAMAALYVDNTLVAYESFSLIRSPNIVQNQILGLIAYNLGNYEGAISYFKAVDSKLSSSARIAYSIAMANTGNMDTKSHEQVLGQILEKSGLANSIIGCLLFSSGEILKAEEFFTTAVKLEPGSEKLRLDLMRVMALNGKTGDVYAGMNAFYIDTGSKFGADEIQKEVETREICLPRPAIKNLFSVASSLFAYKC